MYSFLSPSSLQGSERLRDGLTLIESVMAVTIMTITGSALLTAAMASIQSGALMSQTLVAEGIADQLADEVFLVGFPRGTNVLPTPGTARVLFNHIDDYGDYDRRPPVDRLNRVLGTEDVTVNAPRNAALQPQPGYLDSYRQKVVIERLSPTSSSFNVVTSDTDFRRVTVIVTYTDASGVEVPLAKRTRILSRLGFTP